MNSSVDLNNKEESKEKLILFLLNENMRKKSMKILVDRLFEFDVTVAIDLLDYPEEKQKKIFLDT